MPQPSAVDSDTVNESRRQQRQIRVFQNGEVGGKPRYAEEDRHHEGGDEAAQLILNLLREDRRFPNQHTGDECAQDRVHANGLRNKRHQQHHDQDRGDDGVFADEIVVHPADQPEH